MNKLVRIINEVFQDIFKEDVGGKYLQQKHNIEPEFSNFEKQYASQNLRKNNDEIIYEEGNWKLIKNPTSLQNIGADARGVVLNNGDLYIESYGGERIHNDILKILAEKRIIPTIPRKNWTSQLPQQSGFLTVQRYKNSKNIAIGESNSPIFNQLDYEQQLHNYDEFLNAARSKNPNITFINKLVGIRNKFITKDPNGSNLMNESYLK